MKIQINRIIGSLFLAFCISLAAVAVKADTLLGSSSTGSNPASIYSIDSNTGIATLIGPSGLTHPLGGPGKVSAIALDPISGEFYGMFGSALGCATLITIDPDTGVATEIGALFGAGFDARVSGGICNGGSDALIFGDDGTLYVGGWAGGFLGGSFLTVDKSSGAVRSAVQTDPHPFQPSSIHIVGFARAPDGTMWVSRGANAADALGNPLACIHTIDPVTGGFTSTVLLSETIEHRNGTGSNSVCRTWRLFFSGSEYPIASGYRD